MRPWTYQQQRSLWLLPKPVAFYLKRNIDRNYGARVGNRPGLARLLASWLQWGLAAGWTDSLVVAAVKLVEVVTEGEVVGLL